MPYKVLELTVKEYSALSEAVRFAQETSVEGTDRLNPALSRVQRKLGEVAGTD